MNVQSSPMYPKARTTSYLLPRLVCFLLDLVAFQSARLVTLCFNTVPITPIPQAKGFITLESSPDSLASLSPGPQPELFFETHVHPSCLVLR